MDIMSVSNRLARHSAACLEERSLVTSDCICSINSCNWAAERVTVSIVFTEVDDEM